MIILYIFMIALSALPMLMIIIKMRKAGHINKNGTHTTGIITGIRSQRYHKGGTMDHLTIEYKDRQTGRAYYGNATTAHKKFSVRDTINVVYLPGNPSRYTVTTGATYWPLLVFCFLLFAFVIFAVYEINGMVTTGNYN